MIFTSLVIDNFGVYKGENRFELRPRSNGDETHSIVLFGGKNGSGKTTILEAIRLCLYGRSALGSRVRKHDYDIYITQRLHRELNSHRVQQSQIRLTFEHTHAGVHSIYEAIREWKLEGKKPEESVSIFKNGEPLQDIPSEHWDDFLRDLIPPGVADLFFFDGEQIQALANENTEADALVDAIQGLLNLDLVERLQSDLITYLRRQKSKDRNSLQRKAEQTDQQLDHIHERIIDLKQDRASLKSKLDHATKSIESARQMLLREGGGFIERRDEMVKKRDFIDAEIERVSNDIRNMAAELVPFALVPAWNQRLQARFELESAAKRERLTHEVLQQKAKEIVKRLSSLEFRAKNASALSEDGWSQLLNEIESTLYQDQSHKEILLRHPVSGETQANIQRWMTLATGEIPQELHGLSAYLEDLESERLEVESALKRMPDEDIATPLLDTFHKWANEQGSLNEQIDSLDAEIQRLKLEEMDFERESKRAWKELAQASDLDVRVELAAKAQVILDRYLERITEVKVGELQDRFVEYFRQIARKKNFIHGVEINPQTFQVTLFGENREVIPKTELSAGEKQLYAMALLWALRAVSGRALPIIMDTPMGRLDTDHRLALLDNFFPFAAHQVIILSTDTEINPIAFEHIQDDVSHVYRLEYNENKGCTEVTEGYFGQLDSEMVG